MSPFCQKIALVICLVAVVVGCIVPLVLQLINTLFAMNGTTTPISTSTWYYIISTLGIYHSYSPIVNTTLGSVRGITSVSRTSGREYFEFRGIPYAKPPVDDLRFEPPVPADSWEGLLNADTFGPPCLQFDAMVKGEVVGQENCLKLNIFTPNIKPDILMPVIAYIIGGGFTGGESGIFNPKFIMDHDVVVITFNYRLASLGFLNTGDELIRGNMGLKDQNMVLRFIRHNVEYFGGNPSAVTLMGESAGGASVHYHVVSPLSRGLFHRAIIQSGSLGSPWSFTRNPQHQALRFGKLLNCPVENTTVLVNCLRKMNPRDIVKHHVTIMSPVHKHDDFFPGSVEAVQREDTFLGENPYIMLEKGDFSRVPTIFGINGNRSSSAAHYPHGHIITTRSYASANYSPMPIIHPKHSSRTENTYCYQLGGDLNGHRMRFITMVDNMLGVNCGLIIGRVGNMPRRIVDINPQIWIDGEGLLKTARLQAYSQVLDELDTKWNEHIPVLMHYDPNKTEVSDKLRAYYFLKHKENLYKNEIYVNPAKDLKNLSRMFGVGIFFEGTHRVAKFHAQFAPTYLYYYTYISKSVPSAYAIIRAAQPKPWWATWGEISIAQGMTMYYADKLMWPSKDLHQTKFACHGDDIMQVFSMNAIIDVKTTSADYPFSQELVKTIVQFASEDADLAFNNVSWPMMNLEDEKPKYMELNETGGMIDEPFTEEVKFLESLQIRNPLEPSNW